MLQYRSIERRDGKLPMIQSGDKLPLLTFDASRLAMNDAERGKKLRELLTDEKKDDKPVSAAPAAFAPAIAPPKVPAMLPVVRVTPPVAH